MSETTDKLRGSQSEPSSTGRLTMQEATEILLREQTPPRAPVSRSQPRVREDDDTPAAVADTPPEPREPRAPESTRDEPAEAPETPDVEAAEPAEQTTEEPDSTADEDPEYEIKVGDKLERVKLSDLQNGYLRQQDYSRKTADLSNARRQFETEQSEVRQERRAYSELLTALKRQLEEGQQPINWEELRRTNPVAFLEQRELQRERQAKLGAIREEEQRLQETQQREQQQLLQQAQAEAGQVLLRQIPTWQKPEVRQQEINDLIKTGVEVYGFRPEELNQVFDPRVVRVFRDVMLYHRSRGTTVASKRVVSMPGRPIPAKRSTPQSDPTAVRKQAAQAQFSRKPSINSAIDAILAERGEE